MGAQLQRLSSISKQRKSQPWFQSEGTPRSISKVNSETMKSSCFETVSPSISMISESNCYVLSSFEVDAGSRNREK